MMTTVIGFWILVHVMTVVMRTGMKVMREQ